MVNRNNKNNFVYLLSVVGNLLYAYGGAYKNAVLGDVVPIHCSRISSKKGKESLNSRRDPFFC